MTQARDRRRDRVLRVPGVRRLHRPATETTPAFELGYVRCGPRTSTPVVVIPGGPGLGSIYPYGSLRKQGAALGLDLLMVEHRGVGLSRRGASGHDLPASAMTIRDAVDDLVAVLDAEGVERVVLYGSSYGSYLAQAFGAWYPDRVAAMVLDSTVASADDHRTVRAHARSLLWDGACPQTAESARLVRALVASGVAKVDEISEVARMVYEFAGPEVLERLLQAHWDGRARWTWGRLTGLGRRETDRVFPYLMEFDLVGRIAVRELDYASEPDGGAFDPGAGFRDLADRFGAFEGEPLDLSAHHPRFAWPVVVLAGDRDLRTPRPIAEQVVAAVPDGVLVPLRASGHSALDTHRRAALTVIEAVRSGTHRALAADPARLASVRRTGLARYAPTALRMALSLERIVPRRSRTTLPLAR